MVATALEGNRAGVLPAADDVVGPTARIVPLDVPGTGNRTYVAATRDGALVVDPPRDLDVILDLAAEQGWTITHVAETHVHNDYVSGGRDLARRTGADYLVPAEAGVTCAARSLRDGDVVEVGSIEVRALRTPGHTPHHTSYLVRDADADLAVLTGGGLLYGGVGRTDLLGPDRTLELARAQWRSARRVGAVVSDTAHVLPTHGFGSFCTAPGPAAAGRLLADLRDANDVFALDRDAFTSALVARQGPYPRYFQHMAPLNRAGTPEPTSGPVPVTVLELLGAAADGAWAIDARPRAEFARGHLPGTLSMDLAGPFATYVGWIVPWEEPVHLVVDGPEQRAAAVRELARIGIDVSTVLVLDGACPAARVVQRTASAEELLAAWRRDPHLRVLDVRLPHEWDAGHLTGARHLPVHELNARLAQVARWAGPADRPDDAVWIYCASGFRSALAASILETAGIPAVHVDGRVGGLQDRRRDPGW